MSIFPISLPSLKDMAGSMAHTSVNVAIHGVPKKPVLAATATTVSLAALYIVKPDSLYSQIVTVACSSVGAWALTEGMYYAARKVQETVSNTFFQSVLKSPAKLSSQEKAHIASLLDSIDMEALGKDLGEGMLAEKKEG